MLRWRILILWGFFWLFAFMVSWDSHSLEKNLSEIPLFLFLSGLPLGYGFYKIFQKKKQDKFLQKQRNEKEIILLAKSMKGEVTVVDIAQRSRLSLDETQIILDDLVKRGHADYKVSPNGAIMYRFFLQENENDVASQIR